MTGDRIKRPDGGGGGGAGSGQASDSGEGEDDFVFELTAKSSCSTSSTTSRCRNLVAHAARRRSPNTRSHRAGFVNDGTPSNLDVVRSLRGALGRRIALGAAAASELREAEDALALLEEQGAQDAVAQDKAELLEQRSSTCSGRIARMPFLDPLDLRYRNRVQACPSRPRAAVMFCVMDVSGSMDESRKDLAKRFFILLYLFLTRHYEKIEVVFIRHHTQARRGRRAELLPRHRDGRHGGVQRAGADGRDHPRALSARRVEHLRRAGLATATTGTTTRGRCRELLVDKILPQVPLLRLRQVADAATQNLWEEYQRIVGERAALRDAQGHRGLADLSGVPRAVRKEGAAA